MHCPQCRTEITKRKGGACPQCGQAISLYKGYYYRTEDGSPTLAIVEQFETLVSQQLSKAQGTTIPYRIPRKSSAFRSELVAAERLLDVCEGDLDLARRALRELFMNQLWAFKSRTTLRTITNDFIAALAIARVAAEREAADQNRQTSLADTLARKEDVFA